MTEGHLNHPRVLWHLLPLRDTLTVDMISLSLVKLTKATGLQWVSQVLCSNVSVICSLLLTILQDMVSYKFISSSASFAAALSLHTFNASTIPFLLCHVTQLMVLPGCMD